MDPYYTLHIPFVPREFATVWHPTEATGPFSVLTRCALPSEAEALAWGKAHLGGMPYSVHLSCDLVAQGAKITV